MSNPIRVNRIRSEMMLIQEKEKEKEKFEGIKIIINPNCFGFEI
jgi:hypothetical protein